MSDDVILVLASIVILGFAARSGTIATFFHRPILEYRETVSCQMRQEEVTSVITWRQ
jgi:hypothetical protein